MFAEMLINFCFGKLLHYPYILFIGKVMPNFSGDMTINYSKYSHLLHTVQATMVRHMSKGMVARYKERAMAVMIWNNMSEIRCPCHRCNLRALIKPDSGTLDKHLLMSGFMKGYIDEDVNNGPLPAGNGDVGGQREGEESPKHDEGDAGHDHDDDTRSDGGGEDADTETPLTSALRDPHV
jgi:hypothetical protein